MTWNVWLVTDNEAVRHLFEKTYEKRKNFSLTVYTSREAVRKAMEDASPHVMVISVNLPNGNGYDLCETLKKEGASFPILLIEDIFEDIDLDRCSETRADGFISKPFEGDLIEEKISEIMRSVTASQEAMGPGNEDENIPGGSEEEEKAEPFPALEEESADEERPVSSEDMMEKEDEGIIDLTDLLMEEKEAENPEKESVEREISEEENLPQEKEETEGMSPDEGALSGEMPFEELEEASLIEEELQEIPLEEETLEKEAVFPEEKADDSGDKAEEAGVPPFITSVLEESAHELEKMESMEALPLAEEEPLPESPEEPGAAPPVSPLSEEELKARIREVVDDSVREALENRLPGILKDSLARLLAEISATLR